MPSNTLSLSLPATSGGAVPRETSARIRVGLNISAAVEGSFLGNIPDDPGASFPNNRSLELLGYPAYAVSDDTGLRLTSDLSLSVWFRSTIGGMLVARYAVDDSGKRYFRLRLTGGGQITWERFNHATGVFKEMTTQSETLDDGQWHNVVVTADLGARVFIDGRAATAGSTWETGAIGFTAGGTSPFYLGQQVSSGSPSLNYTGHIDEVSYFDYALTAAQAVDIYNGGVPTNLALMATWLKPIGYWRMGDGTFSATTVANDGTLGSAADLSLHSSVIRSYQAPRPGIILGLTATATRSLTYNVSASFSVGVTVAASTSGDTPATASLTMGVDATAAVTTSFVATASSSVGVTVVATRSLTYNASASSTLGLTVSATVSSSASPLTASMTMGAMMIATRSLQFNPTASMSVGLTAAATRSLQFNPTASMSVGLTAAATVTYVSGFSSSYSLLLDGTNDYVSLGNPSELQITGAMTISVWIKTSDGTNHRIIDKDNSGSVRSWILILVSDKIRWVRFASGGAASTIDSVATVDDGNWHHIAVTNNPSGTCAMYLDGSATSFTEVTTNGDDGITMRDSAANVELGRFSVGPSQFFDGLIDEFAIFDSVLSASDVSSIYNSGEPDDLSSFSPVGWWRMGDGTEDGAGTTVYDMSSNSNNGTLTNGPTYSTDVPS